VKGKRKETGSVWNEKGENGGLVGVILAGKGRK